MVTLTLLGRIFHLVQSQKHTVASKLLVDTATFVANFHGGPVCSVNILVINHLTHLTHATLDKLALIACWVHTLTKCPAGGLLWRKWLSGAEAENGPQDLGGKCPGGGTAQGPPCLKGGPWGGGDPNGGGPCTDLPGPYMFVLKKPALKNK